jgi:tRNA-2-methylthio-N6-dimethylallyladenosine synthase
MRRGYTEDAYRSLIDAVRRTLPDFALTTDIIVGYPGETDEDFEATLRLVQDVRYDGAFMFHYSEREGTRAARTRPDDVPPEVKGERLKRLVAVQEEISRQRYAAMVGREIDVLVTGRSRKNEACLVGRSSCFKTTVLAPGPHEQGAMVRARVTDATSHTLFAEAIQ